MVDLYVVVFVGTFFGVSEGGTSQWGMFFGVDVAKKKMVN
jgi:hypothetical protein